MGAAGRRDRACDAARSRGALAAGDSAGSARSAPARASGGAAFPSGGPRYARAPRSSAAHILKKKKEILFSLLIFRSFVLEKKKKRKKKNVFWSIVP